MRWPFIKRRKPEDRGIFAYWDGKRMRYADPIRTLMALKADPELNLSDHPTLAAKGDLDSLKICARASREVFGIDPLDSRTGAGATDMDAFSVLAAFGSFLDAVKKNTNSTPTSPPPTESVPSEDSITSPA
ncbi:MAG: hypothetical protein KGL39_37245 [Patescibacteria group bacterium]|nr:hypothetical protein [Patescibacteria group bacterium]